jgi:hypothetical protein
MTSGCGERHRNHIDDVFRFLFLISYVVTVVGGEITQAGGGAANQRPDRGKIGF